MTGNLQSLKYSNECGNKPTLVVLDQLLIPHEKVYVDIPDVQAAWSVIRTMQIRGAPLIAIVACLGLSVDINSNATTVDELDAIEDNDSEALLSYIHSKMDYLATSRPTAVNLFNALKELKDVLDVAKSGIEGTSRHRLCHAVIKHAEFMLTRDVADNQAIGNIGAAAILRHVGSGESARIVTICNTGSLATAGYGTALGVARALQSQGKLKSIHALETRPYNQGSRLTAFEIMEEQMPNGTLICDSAAAALMKRKGVDACVVGADRVCANGDTANKIGTYNLSLVAAAHGVPFYIASPFTTLDVSLKTGEEIEIEERPADEMIGTANAPANMPCWNPAFDVTPAKFIAGIITEKGIIEPNIDGTIDVAAFIEKHKSAKTCDMNSTTNKLLVPINYTEQSIASLPIYLATNAKIAMEHLEASSHENLDCQEVGDGNLNLVFIVTNKQNQKKVIVKQSLPYVRCVGESWPLTLERSFFEYQALSIEKVACPAFVPAVYYFSKANGLMVMEYIPPPNIILRKGLIAGIRYPTMASDMGLFCANTLFKTSGFKLSETELRKQVEFWSTNVEMCALTEQVVFTEPYITAANNRWTSPQLDLEKMAIEQDDVLKVEAAKLKIKFVTETQALLHADLHSGSVMCSPSENQTFVIDPEFAFYGPMGFDTGAFIANLLLAYCAQGGHSNGVEYAEWLLETTKTFWTTFESEFVKLWNNASEHTGMAFKREVLGDVAAIALAQKGFMASMFQDTVGFAGMKMLRRVVGIAHVEDLESIQDADVKAECERRALKIAKFFIKERSSLSTIDDMLKVARDGQL